MSKLRSMFLLTNPLLKRLMAWKEGDKEEKWAMRAIDTLIRRLKKDKHYLEYLEYALNHPGENSKCVLLTKSADGRLQVMHRKDLPHVIFCRIWRWPDLKSHHELKSIDKCANPLKPGNTKICVNPYHYRRLGYPVTPPILVPRIPEYLNTPLPAELQQPAEPRVPGNVSYGIHGFSVPSSQGTGHHNNGSENNNFRAQIYPNTNIYNNQVTNYHTQPQGSNVNYSNYNNATGNYMNEHGNNYAAGNIGNENYNPNNTNCNGQLTNMNRQITNMNGQITNMGGNVTIENQSCNGGITGYNVEEAQQVNASPPTDQSVENSTQFSQILSEIYTLDNYYREGNLTPPEVASMQVAVTKIPEPRPFTPVSYPLPKYWASIVYYELNTRVGESFQCEPTSVIVDGYTNPHSNSNRFCVGMLSNVKRSSSIENTRKSIGKGVALHYYNGELIAECLSESAVFVQSRNFNHFHQFHSSTVCKILPGCNVKIFSNEHFAELLSQSVHYGFDAVYELTKMCTIRMSFVKGWGAEYQRQDVTSTPCWIEVHLNGPLQWLDLVLNQMGPSLHRISSVS